MRIHARMLLILAVCIAALLLAARAVNFGRKKTVQTGEFTARYDTAIQNVRAETVAISRKLAQNGAYDPALIAVPVPPPAEKQTAESRPDDTVTLQGVSWSPENPVAMINGKNYKTGDRVGSRVVETILPLRVILRNADGTALEVSVAQEKRP